MLSTTSTSSIQKRRQQHRRQQSLDVPMLAQSLPAGSRRTQQSRNAHRRGLSLDQSLIRPASAAVRHRLQPQGQRQDLRQDQDHDNNQDHRPGSSPVRIQPDSTNTGHPMNRQHHQQETQQQSLAQPGFQAQDFQTHLLQQINGHMQTQQHVIAPTPINQASQQQALQQLQSHVEWYNKNFGSSSPEPSLPFDFGNNAAATLASLGAINGAILPAQQQISGLVQNGVQSQMVNFTQPQALATAQGWSSPRPTHAKHTRSQSFQIDTSTVPMVSNAVNHSLSAAVSSPPAFVEQINAASGNCFTISNDNGYASSTYSSSIVDPMSPERQVDQGGSSLPTLYEDSMTSTFALQQSAMGGDGLLLQAVSGAASTDFNSPNFVIGGGASDADQSPKAALLDNLGPQVNASIIDTGIPMDNIDEHISEQDPKTRLFYCLWIEKDGKRCNKWHKRKENARSHVQGHLGDRQFLCNDCGKTFVRQHDMKRHAAIHNPERPHCCPCGSRFARHDALTRHRQRGMCTGTLPGFERSEEDKPKRGRPRKKDRLDDGARTNKAQRARRMDRENAAQANDHAGAGYTSSNDSCAASDDGMPMTPPDTSDDFDADAFVSMAEGNGAGSPAAIGIDSHDSLSFETLAHNAAWNDTPPTSPVASAEDSHVHGTVMSAMQTYGLVAAQYRQSHAQGISPAVLSQTCKSSPPPTAHRQAQHAHQPSPVSSPPTAFDGASSPLANYSTSSGAEFDLGAIDTHPDAVAGAAGDEGTSPAPAFFSDAFSPSDDSSGSECEYLVFPSDNTQRSRQQLSTRGTALYDDDEAMDLDNPLASASTAAFPGKDCGGLFGDADAFPSLFDGRADGAADDGDISLLHALDAYIASH